MNKWFCLSFLAYFFFPNRDASAQFFLDLEGNYIASIPYNEVRIPSEGGTQIDLAKDLNVITSYTFRIRANYIFRQRHLVSVLFAPLIVKSTGMIDKTIVYSDEVFKSNDPLEATYKFNSYRLTYRYLFVRNEDLILGAGLTAKVRDANITLRNGNQMADFPDLGIVPLINFYALWSPVNNWMALLEGDALVTGKGRAEDVFLGIGYRFSDMFILKGGYRVLEGGANVSRNYNFTFVNYLALGVIVSF